MKQIIESKLEQLKKGLSALENKRVPVNDVNLLFNLSTFSICLHRKDYS